MKIVLLSAAALCGLLALTHLAAEEPKDTTDPKALIKTLILTQPGDLPIILSAPHGGRTPFPGIAERENDAIAKFVKVRDDNTLEIARLVADRLEKDLGAKPYFVAARFERKYIDVNRPADDAYESPEAKPVYDAYHQFLADSCAGVQKRFGEGLLVDLHGQAFKGDTVFRGTRNGKTTTLLRQRHGQAALTGPKSLFGRFAALGWAVSPAVTEPDAAEEQRYGGGHIVQSYGSHGRSGVDAIQVELGTDYRAKDQIATTAKILASSIALFAKTYLPQKEKSR